MLRYEVQGESISFGYMLNRIVLGMTAKQFRDLKGIPKGDPIRPHMAKAEAELMNRLQIVDVGLQYSVPDFYQRKRQLEWYANQWREKRKITGIEEGSDNGVQGDKK